MSDTPRSERVHIAFFGSRNAGKSSLINAVTGQPLAIVSSSKGTTTDPVYKSIEILPLGPCVLVDTAGLDDVGELGGLRVEKSLEVLDKCDIALVVIDAAAGATAADADIIARIKEKKRPFLILLNKSDLIAEPGKLAQSLAEKFDVLTIPVSAVSGAGIAELKNSLPGLLPEQAAERYILDGVVSAGDVAALVCPIDSAAPKGRLILPQQQVIRELCDLHCGALVCQVGELAGKNLIRRPE